MDDLNRRRRADDTHGHVMMEIVRTSVSWSVPERLIDRRMPKLHEETVTSQFRVLAADSLTHSSHSDSASRGSERHTDRETIECCFSTQNFSIEIEGKGIRTHP